MLMSRLIDLSGQKFGEWLVIERAMNNKSGQAQWLCSCSCGSKKDGELKYLIEYDGVQHFKHKGSGWNTEECLQKNIVNDDIKNKYCEKKQIPLIRIPYDKEYSIKDVVLFDFLKK